jgi:exosortase K
MLTMILAVGLKYHYSIASAADLKWILRPTATLVEIITGNSYIFEKGTGYINKEIGIIIAKSCAGVNFLIIVFGMSVFTVLHHLKSHWIKYSTFLGSLICAFLLTISVNTIRIIGAIKLFQMEGTILWLNRSEIHRLEGIIFYFLFLYLFYLALKSIIFRYQYAQEK